MFDEKEKTDRNDIIELIGETEKLKLAFKFIDFSDLPEGLQKALKNFVKAVSDLEVQFKKMIKA
jgi:hypothetical protein